MAIFLEDNFLTIASISMLDLENKRHLSSQLLHSYDMPSGECLSRSVTGDPGLKSELLLFMATVKEIRRPRDFSIKKNYVIFRIVELCCRVYKGVMMGMVRLSPGLDSWQTSILAQQ